MLGNLVGSWTGRLVVLAIVVAVGGGAIVAMRATAAPAKVDYRTVAAAKGSVTQTVAVSGSVNAASVVKLNFKTAGKLAALYVTVGQRVTAGQPVAKLETGDLETALAQAQANLQSTAANYQRVVAGLAPEDLAVAQQSLNRMKSGYDSSKAVFLNGASGARTDVVVLQNAVDGLQSSLLKAQSDLQPVAQPTPTPIPTITPAPTFLIPTPAPTSNTSLTDARTAWNSVNQAQAYATNAQSYGADQLRAALGDYNAASASLSGALAAFDTALAAGADTSTAATIFQTSLSTYSTTLTRLSSTIDIVNGLLGSAQGALNSAQNALNTGGSKFEPNLNAARADIAAELALVVGGQQTASSAKSKLNQANTALGTVTDAVSGSYISALQSFAKTTATPKPYDIASAYSSLLSQQNAVTNAQANLDGAVLTAPVAAVVSSVAAQVGEIVSSSGTTGFIVLANTGTMALHGTIGEADVGKLSLGQVANVTVDAVGTARMTGKVSSIDPVATISQGVPVYGVDVTVDVPSAALRPGMTGTAAVIIASKQDVITVANLAIRSSGGRRLVQVLTDGVPVDTDVTFGIANETVTEVTSGLKVGDLVVLPQPRAAASGAAGGGAQIRGPGFGGGF